MAGGRHCIVTVDEVTATVGGEDVSSIAELYLTAQANTPPVITLLVDAKHPGRADSEAADGLALVEARDTLLHFREMVKKRKSTLTLHVKVTLSGRSDDDEVQELDLKDWLLIDATVSPIRFGSMCYVALTFSHPLCLADFGGALPGVMRRDPDLTAVSTASPYDAFRSALGIYGSVGRLPLRDTTGVDAPQPESIKSNLTSRMNQAASDLDAHVLWTGGGLPLSGVLEGWDQFVAMGIATFARPYSGTSVLQRLTRSLIPECSLAMGGDYTKAQLQLHPFVPWAEATFAIEDSDIFGLQFPQSDPAPLSGVHIGSFDGSDSGLVSWSVDVRQTERKPSVIYYVPQEELGAEIMYGPIFHISEPSWLTKAQAYMLDKSDAGQSDAEADAAGKLHSGANTPRGEVSFTAGGELGPPKDYAAAMQACAKAYYETALMKDWSFVVDARLLFRLGEAVLCPGEVISVKSGGAEVIGGYITAVTHTLSIREKVARTSITCSHPRFANLPPPIKSRENALYEG